VKKYIQDHVLDAGFRVGLSAMKHSSPDNDALKELDEYANEYILAQTLSVPSQERVNALSARVGEKAAQKELEKNAAQQVVFAKTLFLAQLGKYTLKEGRTYLGQSRGKDEVIRIGKRANKGLYIIEKKRVEH
jgi:hypothetical protein